MHTLRIIRSPILLFRPITQRPRPNLYTLRKMSMNSISNPYSSSSETTTTAAAKPLALALPSSKTTSTSETSEATTSLNVNGDAVKLDHLGPVVVNQDGTLSRINNWAEMSEIERTNTLRVLGKRNQARLERVREMLGKEEEGKGM